MIDPRKAFRTAIVLAACLAVPGGRAMAGDGVPAGPAEDGIDARNGGAVEAQADFARGMTALHNFAFDSAAGAFEAAVAADPGFALAWWGGAMTHAHFVWGDEDVEAGRAVLERARRALADRDLDSRQRVYLKAAEALFGEGDREARGAAFETRIADIAARHPEDREAAIFQALALLRRGPQGEPAPVARRMRAARILTPLFREMPRHPGVLHYLIHAHDDAERAHLALPAARAYETVALGYPHALHMPSHIYLQLGLWEDAARANVNAYAASLDPEGPGDGPDLHSLEWLHFVRLQQGRLEDAAALLNEMERHAAGSDARTSRAAMRMTARTRFASGTESEAAMPDGDPFLDLFLSYPNALYAAGVGAARRGDEEETTAALDRLDYLREAAATAGFSNWAGMIGAMRDAIRAVAAWRAGETGRARAMFERAIRDDAANSPTGKPSAYLETDAGALCTSVAGGAGGADQSLPNPVKPVAELYGEMLADLGEAPAAARLFRAVLKRHPRRPAALLGLARALDAAGETAEAACRYRDLAAIRQGADAGAADYRERARGCRDGG